MSNSLVIIHELRDLYDSLKETEDFTKFKVLNSKDVQLEDNIIKKKYLNYVLISKKDERKIMNLNRLIQREWPIKIEKLFDKINISLLKKNYLDQSKISIKNYNLDINARKLKNKEKEIKLTQKETEIILFLNKSKNAISISKLQKEVWEYNLELETHTVETHIYRLRKKIFKNFNDKNFILSTDYGYKI